MNAHINKSHVCHLELYNSVEKSIEIYFKETKDTYLSFTFYFETGKLNIDKSIDTCSMVTMYM